MRGRRGNGQHQHHQQQQQQQQQHYSGGGQQQQRRINPRMQTFDSNGPEVRIRGNAVQVNEKYAALARDAMSAGDRVLGESYLQHAEHYQRLINEMNEEYARYQAQYQQQYGTEAPHESGGDQPQPTAEGMSDLDQGFLVGSRQQASGGDGKQDLNGNNNGAPAQVVSSSAGMQGRHSSLNPKETQTV